MSVIVAYSAAATGSPLNKAKPPKHSLNETGKFIILRLTVSPKIFPHCLTVADCNPCGASQIHIGVIKSGSSGRELTQEIMIIVTIVRTVSIAKNSPYRIERYRECYIVFANTISPLFTRPQGRYKVYRRNSCSNNQKRLLLMSNLRDDNDRYFQWCCCEHYLQRHNTL